MCTSVENLGDRLEALLPCRVPDLQFAREVAHAYDEWAELDADRHLVVFGELVVAHAVHQTRLADTRVTDHNQLEEHVLTEGAWARALRGNDLVRQLLDRGLLNFLDLLGFFGREHSVQVVFSCSHAYFNLD